MADQATKTVYYFRARRDGKPFDLEAVVVKARKKKRTVGESEVELGGGDVVRIQHYKATGHVLLHLARYVPGVGASTLEPKAAVAEDDEGSQAAPRGKEFKDGDCFLLISGFHVLYCGHGISQQKAALYLSQLFRAAKLHDEASGFDLAPASNLDKLKLMQEHGVRSVELATNAFAMSLPKAKRSKWIARTFGSLGDELQALVTKDDDATKQKALEDLLVNIEVRLDGNTRASQSSQKFIEELAETVLDDKDAPISEFVIVTQNDERITSSQIRLQATVKVDKKDNSLSHASVWTELDNYLGTIAAGHLLEQ